MLTPLWSNPVGWSERTAGTRLRLVLCSLSHIVAVVLSFGFIGWLFWFVEGARPTTDFPGLYLCVTFMAAGPVLMTGVGFPIMYLYAIHRLLKIVKARDSGIAEGDGG